MGYDTYVLTPAVWHPHLTTYADNEAGRVDWEGNIKEKEGWSFRVVLDDIPPEDETTRVASTISSVETKMINCVCDQRDLGESEPDIEWRVEPDPNLQRISSVLGEDHMTKNMLGRAEFGHDCMAISATSVVWDDNPYVVTDDDGEPSDSSNESGSITSDMDLDECFVSGVTAGKSHGVDAARLSEVWQISYDDAKQMIQAMSHHST